jgi:hypothetical protein
MVALSFITAFSWMASLIYRHGIQDPSLTTLQMQADLEQFGIFAFFFDLVIALLILNMIRPQHRMDTPEA